MTLFFTFLLVATGVGLSAWLALVSYDLGSGFRRFAARAARPAAPGRATSTASPTAAERADGVV